MKQTKWCINGSKEAAEWIEDIEAKGKSCNAHLGNRHGYYFNPSKDFSEWNYSCSQPEGYTLLTFKEFQEQILGIESETVLKVTKERVLEAAKGCSQVEEVLKIMFPEAFENDVFIPTEFYEGKMQVIHSKEEPILEVRTRGKYRNKAIYLSVRYDWELVEEDEHMILIPIKKW
jgi:hypothetical protein